MGRTVNRIPRQFNTPSSSAIKTSYFQQMKWTGICEDKNTYGVDQNSFAECENVYVDRDNVLCNRPCTVAVEGLPVDLTGYKLFETKLYLFYIKFDDVSPDIKFISENNNKQIVVNSVTIDSSILASFKLETNVYLYELGNILFVFGAKSIYKIIKNNGFILEDASDNLYIPSIRDIRNKLIENTYYLEETISADDFLTLKNNKNIYESNDLVIKNNFNNIEEDWPYDIDYLQYCLLHKTLVNVPMQGDLIIKNNKPYSFLYISSVRLTGPATASESKINVAFYFYSMINGEAAFSIDVDVDIVREENARMRLDYINVINQPYKDDIVYCCFYADEEVWNQSTQTWTFQKRSIFMAICDYRNETIDVKLIQTTNDVDYLIRPLGIYRDETQYLLLFGRSDFTGGTWLYNFNENTIIYYNSSQPSISNDADYVYYDNDHVYVYEHFYRMDSEYFYRYDVSKNGSIDMLELNSLIPDNVTGTVVAAERTLNSYGVMEEYIYVLNNDTDILYRYLLSNSSLQYKDEVNCLYGTPCFDFYFSDNKLQSSLSFYFDMNDKNNYPIGSAFYGTKKSSAFIDNVLWLLTSDGLFVSDVSGLSTNLYDERDDITFLIKINNDRVYSGDVPSIIKPIGSNSFLYFTSDTSYILQVRYNNEVIQLYLPVNKINKYYDEVIDAELSSDKSLLVIGNNMLYNVIDTEQQDDNLLPIFQYVRSKLNLNVIPKSDNIIAYNGSTILMMTYNGVAAVNYSQLISTEEQTVQYITDNIMTHWFDYVANANSIIKTCNHNYYLFVYNTNRSDTYIFDYRTGSWWYWTFDKKILMIKTFGLRCCIVFDDLSCYYFAEQKLEGLKYNGDTYEYDKDVKYVDANWRIKSQKLHLGVNTNYKQIRRFTLHTIGSESEHYNYLEQTGDNVINLTLTNYRKQMDEGDTITRWFNVDFVRTYVIRLNYPKVYEMQYELSSDASDLKPLFLTGVTIEYKIGGKVR